MMPTSVCWLSSMLLSSVSLRPIGIVVYMQAAWAQKEQSESANTALHAQRQAQLAQMQAVQHQQQQRGDSAAGGLRARYPSGSDAAGQAGDALELGQMLGAGAGRAGGTSMRMGQGGLQYSVEDIQSAIQVSRVHSTVIALYWGVYDAHRSWAGMQG